MTHPPCGSHVEMNSNAQITVSTIDLIRQAWSRFGDFQKVRAVDFGEIRSLFFAITMLLGLFFALSLMRTAFSPNWQHRCRTYVCQVVHSKNIGVLVIHDGAISEVTCAITGFRWAFSQVKDWSNGLSLAFERPMVFEDAIVKNKLRLAADRDRLLW